PSKGRLSCDSVRKPFYCVSMNLTRESARVSFSILLTFALVASTGCASLYPRPDPEIMPPRTVDETWSPPLSITNANASISNIQQLRRYQENEGPAHPREYDLPSLVDVALRTSPETRRAWYAALQANAQLGQAEAADYPQVEAHGEGGYLKLP